MEHSLYYKHVNELYAIMKNRIIIIEFFVYLIYVLMMILRYIYGYITIKSNITNITDIRIVCTSQKAINSK